MKSPRIPLAVESLRADARDRVAHAFRALLPVALLALLWGCAAGPDDIAGDVSPAGRPVSQPVPAPAVEVGPVVRMSPPAVVGGDVLVEVGADKVGVREVVDRLLERHREIFDQVLKDLLIEIVVRRENAVHKVDVPERILDAEVERDLGLYEKQSRLQYQMGFKELLAAQGRTVEQFTTVSRAHALYMHTLRRLVRYAQLQRGAVKVRHIVVKTREEAQGIRAKLEQGADFAALAKQHSLDASRRDGGRLAMVVPGVYAAAGHTEVEAAIAALEVGILSPVVEAKTGFHVFEALYREPPNAGLSYAELADRVVASLERFPANDEEIEWWLDEIRPRYPLIQHF